MTLKPTICSFAPRTKRTVGNQNTAVGVQALNNNTSGIRNTACGHKALFYNEQEGYLETFRPYALPKESWVDEAGEKLARLHGAADVAG